MHRAGADPLTVSEVLGRLKLALVRGFPNLVVTGEVVDPFLSRNGHLYLSLRDQGGELKVVMWRREAQRLRTLPQAGEQVVVRGSLTIFAPRGELQMQALALAKAGLGDKMAELSELKAKLQAEGVFERAKRDLPFLPRRLGVVTSAGGAVLHDIFQCVRRRNPSVEVWLSPSAVSGPEAPIQLRKALRRLRDRVELVIIARGGGSFEELLPFSDETLVREVADYPVPVISAIGHGSDSTLLDLVADAHAATPTAAAELATPSREELLRAHRLLRRAAAHAVRGRLLGERRELTALNKLCQGLRPGEQIFRARTLWSGLSSQLQTLFGQRLKQHRERVNSYRSRLELYPWGLRVDKSRQQLETLRERLLAAQAGRIAQERQRLEQMRLGCLRLGPGEVLKRGFAMVLSAGVPVTTALGRRPGEELELQLADGTLTVSVTSVTRKS